MSAKKTEVKASGKKEKVFPHILVVLFVVIFVAMVATYIVPAGQYERIMDEATGKMVIDPNSFKYIPRTPVGVFETFVSIEEGLIEAANITFLIFCAFSSLYLLDKTGALDASISRMVTVTQEKPQYRTFLLVVLMAILSIWASTGTMSYEEIIAFIPVFIALSYAFGYDALVALGISVIPVGVGFAAATVNPFSIGVAQTIAELPIFSGIKYRIVILIVMTTFTIIYVLRYAAKIKSNPDLSLVKDLDYSDMTIDDERMNTPFTTARKLSILALFVAIAFMAFGLIKLGWYINEVAAIFMILSIVVGLINRWKANRIAEVLVEGLSKAVLSAIVVGVARGILVVISKGNILDTIIHGATSLLQKLSLYGSAVGMLIFQTILNFLIPSGSGQAAVSMPIMTPIADIIGLSRQTAVLAFQFGDGFSNLLWPTGFMLLACTLARVPLNRYYKFMTGWFVISFILQIIFMVIAVNIGYA